jgi:hypothetical protein
MAGVYKLEITESEEELKEMLGKQKTASDKERVQVLDNAQLDSGFGEYGLNCIGKPRQPIDATNQDILDSAIL